MVNPVKNPPADHVPMEVVLSGGFCGGARALGGVVGMKTWSLSRNTYSITTKVKELADI